MPSTWDRHDRSRMTLLRDDLLACPNDVRRQILDWMDQSLAGQLKRNAPAIFNSDLAMGMLGKGPRNDALEWRQTCFRMIPHDRTPSDAGLSWITETAELAGWTDPRLEETLEPPEPGLDGEEAYEPPTPTMRFR